MLDKDDNVIGGYDVANKRWICPAAGTYRPFAKTMANFAAGERIRLAIVLNGALVVEEHSRGWSDNGDQSVSVNGALLQLQKGDAITVWADAPSAPAYGGGSSSEIYCNQFTISLA